RIDARTLPAGASVSATVSAGGTPLPALPTPTRTLGVVNSGATFSIDGGRDPGRIGSFNVIVKELLTNTLKPRSAAPFGGPDTSPTPATQNVPGAIYNTETGFRNATFPVMGGQGDLSTAGLADSGTQVLVRVNGAPAGVQLQIPTVVNL